MPRIQKPKCTLRYTKMPKAWKRAWLCIKIFTATAKQKDEAQLKLATVVTALEK